LAFNISNLVVSDAVAYDFDYGRVWSYSTSDSMVTVDGETYWNTTDAAKALRKGDWVKATASDGKAIYMVVNSIYSSPEVTLVKQASVSSF
jgi:hypothetical protein